MTADTVEIRVRYADTDQMGHVYYAHFLRFFEIGRTEYLRKIGMAYRDLEAGGCYLVVVRADCRYLSPARYDDVLELTTWVARLRPTRIDFRHEVRRQADARALAEGGVVLACVDAERRPQRLPPRLVDLIRTMDAPGRLPSA